MPQGALSEPPPVLGGLTIGPAPPLGGGAAGGGGGTSAAVVAVPVTVAVGVGLWALGVGVKVGVGAQVGWSSSPQLGVAVGPAVGVAVGWGTGVLPLFTSDAVPQDPSSGQLKYERVSAPLATPLTRVRVSVPPATAWNVTTASGLATSCPVGRVGEPDAWKQPR